MENNMENNKPEVPEALLEALTRALQAIAIHVHKESGMSMAYLSVSHASDCMSRAGETLVRAQVGGQSVSLKRPDAKKMAEDMLKQVLESRKEGK